MEKWFDGQLSWQQLVIDPQGNLPDAQPVRDAMYDKIKAYGAVIIDGRSWQDLHAMQLRLAQVFGEIGRHNRANEEGVVTIAPLKGLDDYLGASHDEHPLHTDGPFEAIQPLVMTLLCDRQSKHGGETTLVSSKAVYLHLLKHEPASLKALFDLDAMYIERAGQAATVPMFKVEQGRIRLAFRYDGIVKVRIKGAGKAAFEALLSFIKQPQNVACFSLNPQHLLIADNGSVLHGRNAFPEGEDRRMFRLNLNGGCDPKMDTAFGFEAPLPPGF